MRISFTGRVKGIPQNEEELKHYLHHFKIIKNDCWLHPKKIRRGYAMTRYKDGIFNVSRLSAYLYLGLDLEDKKLHGLHKAECPNKNCWNPDHIYIGTHKDNMRDVVEEGYHHQQIKTHCDSGHKFTDSNTYIRPNGNRTCRECNRLITAKRRNKV